VYLAKRIDNEEIYAIKEISDNPTIAKELKISNSIGYDHGCSEVIKIYESFSEKNSYYIVMEYCKKGSLTKYIKEQQFIIEENVYILFLFLFFIFF
jgi:serine/threonine protein kinase